MSIERTAVIGDIHGCLDEFKELLKLIDVNSPHVRVICLGDLIDRGPDSVGVVRLAQELHLESVLGNHEHKFFNWHRSPHANLSDKFSHYLKFSEKDIAYLAALPRSIQIDNTIIVHAGLKPGIALSAQKPDDLLYLRYTDLNGKFISIKKIAKIGKQAAGAHFWTEFWKGPQSIVYGHNVCSIETPLIEEVAPSVFCYGIDTGCCFGGKLSSLILETKEIIQVPAKQTYYKSEFTII